MPTAIVTAEPVFTFTFISPGISIIFLQIHTKPVIFTRFLRAHINTSLRISSTFLLHIVPELSFGAFVEGEGFVETRGVLVARGVGVV